MPDDCGGMDAFNALLDLYTEQVRKNGELVGDRNAAHEEARRAENDAREVRRSIHRLHQTIGLMTAHRDLLIDARSQLLTSDTTPAPLLARLQEAIGDSDVSF